MANTTTWTGAASDGDWDNATNWSNGVPVAASTVIIDGAENISGGEPTADTFLQLYVAYTYTGAIGSAGTPLQVDCPQVSFDSTSLSMTAYLDLLGTTHTTPDVQVDGSNSNYALYLSGAIDRLIIASTMVGKVMLGNSATFTADIKNLYLSASGCTVDASNAANVAWQSDGTILMAGGLLIVAENFGTNGHLIMSAGALTVNQWVKTTGDTITLMGGRISWEGGSTTFSASAINTVNTLNVLGGTFTLESNQNGYVDFGAIYQFGGDINMESSFANVDITTTYERFSGGYTPPKQSTISTTKLA